MTSAAPLSISCSPITSADGFDAIVKIEEEAYGSSGIMALMFGDPASLSPAEHADSTAVRANRHKQSSSSDPTSRYVKATTHTGEIVGLAVWNFYTKTGGSQDPWPKIYPKNANVELCEHYFSRLVETREEMMGERPYFLMANLVVSPKHQRKGIGRMLLEWGLEKADHEGVECWIDASRFGIGLYRKMGWEEIQTLEFDLEKWGGRPEEVHRTVCMVRRPRSR